MSNCQSQMIRKYLCSLSRLNVAFSIYNEVLITHARWFNCFSLGNRSKAHESKSGENRGNGWANYIYRWSENTCVLSHVSTSLFRYTMNHWSPMPADSIAFHWAIEVKHMSRRAVKIGVMGEQITFTDDQKILVFSLTSPHRFFDIQWTIDHPCPLIRLLFTGQSK